MDMSRFAENPAPADLEAEAEQPHPQPTDAESTYLEPTQKLADVENLALFPD
jgi:cell cycle checkpoint control protein RAD9A